MKIYVNAPGEPFCLSATKFLKNTRWNEACPYRLEIDGKCYPTQWQLVAETSEGICVEFSAKINDTYQGPLTFNLIRGASLSERFEFNEDMLSLLKDIKLIVKPQDAEEYEIALNFLTRPTLHRSGCARNTFTTHVTSPYIAVHAFLDLKAHSNSYDLDLNIHNGQLPARGKFYFDYVKLLLPNRLEFSEHIPYGTKNGHFLIKPFKHVMLQRQCISRRLAIHKTNEIPKKKHWGQGFADYLKGDYLVQRFEVGVHPEAQSKLDSISATTWHKFENNEGVYSNIQMPVSENLLKPADVPYQGATGGSWIDQITNAFTPMLKDVKGLETAWIEEYRFNSRQKSWIFEQNGFPAMPEDYLNADGSTPWQIFSGNFQTSGGQVQDAPFYFSKARANNGQCPYESQFSNWMNIDAQHIRRITGRMQMLVWLTNDPMSKIFLHAEAQMCKMSYWTGTNGRWDINKYQKGKTLNDGRALAWILDCVVHSAAFSTNTQNKLRDLNYCRIVGTLIRHAQSEKGAVYTHKANRAFNDPPFSSQYYLFQAYEHCFIITALLGLFRLTGDYVDCLVKAIKCLCEYGWKDNGPYHKVPIFKKQAANTFIEMDEIDMPFMKHVHPERYNFACIIGTAYHALLNQNDSRINVEKILFDYTSANNFTDAMNVIISEKKYGHMENTLGLLQTVTEQQR